MTTIPLITQPLDDVSVNDNAVSSTVNLFERFDDPFTTGQVARFELENSSLGGGVTDVLLFDQEGTGAPQTVANFANYVNDGDYVNSIIHRSVPGFIVQGGGFTVQDGLQVGDVPADDAVENEYSEDRSNTRGTIAMAKLGNDPNSATNQWFFNLGDNAANLDTQNGGFTVFGEVLTEEDLAPVDAIAELPIVDSSGANPAFTDLPISVENAQSIDSGDDLVRYKSVTISERYELTFEITANSNPNLVDAFVAQGELYVDYIRDRNGTADITVQATDLLGDSVEDTFSVTVADDGVETDPSQKDANLYYFVNEDTGARIYTACRAERDEVLGTLPNYQFDSISDVNVEVDYITGDGARERLYRFSDQNTGDSLYTLSETDPESLFAGNEAQPDAVPIYSFYNEELGGRLYTSSEAEKAVIEDTLPDYTSEGIAYYSFTADI